MHRLTIVFFLTLCISTINAQSIALLGKVDDIEVVDNDSIRIAGPAPEYFVVQFDTSFNLVKSEQILTLNQKWIAEVKVLRELTPELMEYKTELTEGIIIIRFKRSKEKKVKKLIEIDYGTQH